MATNTNETTKRKEYIQCQERLEEQLQCSDDPPGFSHLTVWDAYEKAYYAFCIELMKTGEQEILKNRRCGSEVVILMRYHALQRSKYTEKTGNNEKEGDVKGGERLASHLAYINEFKVKWSQMGPRTMTEELIDLVSIDMKLEDAEPDMIQQILTYPENGLEYMERRLELIKLLQNKWNICIEELPHQLKHLEQYKAFRDNWQSHLKEGTLIPPEQELILLKQLIAKPELEVVRSTDEFWKILDFTYGEDISIIPIQKAHLKAGSSHGVERATVMVAVLRTEIVPPIATSAVQLYLLKSFKEQRSAFPCLRSCKKVDCDHNVLVFDGMIVEEDATPMGLGMDNRDTLGIVPRYNAHNMKEKDEIVETFGGLGLLQTIINRTKRDEKQVSVGLNIVMGETEGGLPLLINQELKSLSNLKLKTGEDEGAKALPTLEPTVYVGPVRNATPDNFLSSLPIVQFQGVRNWNSVDQLIDAWCHYTREHSKHLEVPEYLMYNNKRCNKKVRIKDLGMVPEGLYFSLPLSYKAHEDDRDIEQLLDFIEGEDGKEKKDKGEKKKKRKKKKIAAEQPAAGEKSKIGHKEQTSTDEAALGINTTESPRSSLELEATNLDDKRAQIVEKEANEQNTASEKSKARYDQTEEAALGHDPLESPQSSLKPTKLDDQRAQIEEKEILIQRSRDFLEQIVEVRGKEMAKLITDIEAVEDEKGEKLKEKSVVEMQISDLQTKHKSLVLEIKERDEAMMKLIREKRDLETHIEDSVFQTKKEIALLEEDMKSLATCLPIQSPNEARSEEGRTAKRVSQPNLQLLEFINGKIKAKEQELECPVCLEVAAPPIFTCSDLHLICSDCRPKVTPYEKKPMDWFEIE